MLTLAWRKGLVIMVSMVIAAFTLMGDIRIMTTCTPFTALETNQQVEVELNATSLQEKNLLLQNQLRQVEQEKRELQKQLLQASTATEKKEVVVEAEAKPESVANNHTKGLPSIILDPITEDDIVSQACDFGYRIHKRNDLSNGKQVFPHAVVCVMASEKYLKQFFEKIVPDIQGPFTVVSLEHDDPVPNDPTWLDHKFLTAWFGWNIKMKHPRLHALPIGLNAKSMKAGIIEARKRFLHRKRNGKVLVNFKEHGWGGGQSERGKAARAASKWDFAETGKYDTSLQKRDRKGRVDTEKMVEYYEYVSRYSFLLCPRGMGEDTHRLWEALYLGLRPIALKSPLSPLYEGLPVVQLDKWEDFTKEMLEEELKKDANFDSNELHLKTWVDRIRTTAKKDPQMAS